jgi:ABC-2 type transport system permease protein
VIGLLRAELLKQRTTRTTLALLGAMLALILLAAVLHGFALAADQLASRDDQMHVYGWAELGVLFAALAGAMSITGEIRHGTIRPTFLVTPRRGRVIAAKAVAAGLAGLGFGLVAAAFAIGVGSAALAARGITLRLDVGDYARLVAGAAAAAPLWAVIGVGLGALVRNQATAVAGLFAWLLFVEGLLFGQLPDFGRFLPGVAGAAIAGTTATGEVRPLLAPALGVLLLAAYAAAALAAGSITTARRDVG